MGVIVAVVVFWAIFFIAVALLALWASGRFSREEGRIKSMDDRLSALEGLVEGIPRQAR